MTVKVHNVTLCVLCVSGEAFEQSPIRRSFKSKVLVHYPESTDRNPFKKDGVNMVRPPPACTLLDVIHVSPITLPMIKKNKMCLVLRDSVSVCESRLRTQRHCAKVVQGNKSNCITFLFCCLLSPFFSFSHRTGLFCSLLRSRSD